MAPVPVTQPPILGQHAIFSLTAIVKIAGLTSRAIQMSKPVNGAFVRFKVWYRVLRRAGLRAVRLQDLRRTFATLLLEAGTPIAYAQGQLGNSSNQMTVDRYGHIRPGGSREAVDQFVSSTAPGPPAPRNLGST